MPSVFTERDKALIQAAVDFTLQRVQNTPSRPSTERGWAEGQDHQSPEVYIAKTSDGSSIPAFTAGSPDKPGEAECDIYAIGFDSSDEPEIRQVEDFTKTVYNCTGSSIGGDAGYFTVHRDKFGRWIAGNSNSKPIVRLWCKTEIDDDDAKTDKVGAYNFQEVERTLLNGQYRWTDKTGGISGSYPSSYARELNYSNANLHQPTNNLVLIEFITEEDGITIYWFDKALTDEAYEDRDVFTPEYEYCLEATSSTST